MRATFGRRLLLAVMFALVTTGTAAAGGPVFNTVDGAIHGYDPVAYFEQGKPVKGSLQHTYVWHRVTWRFASAAHLDAFKADPEKYAPQYGGYCAWAVSQGATAPSDPTAWTIVDDKLYLNYSVGVQRRWRQDIPRNVAIADRQWPLLLSRLE